ncbi:hypothetical protein ACFW04_014629 [Cataglyphis niger]
MNYYVPRDEIKFALTRTTYKYLDIGISVGSEFVELQLDDIRGNHIIPHERWEIFIKRRIDIERFLQSNISSLLRIEYLVIEHVKIHDASVVKLTLDDSCLYMKPAIILFYSNLNIA